MKTLESRQLSLFIITAVTLLSASGLTAQPATEDWVDTYPGFWSVGVVTDDTGGVYVTGRGDLTLDNGFRSDIVTIRYDLDGNRLWVREYDEAGDATNGTDEPVWLTLDPFGNLIVTGVSFINGTGDDIFTLKYDPDGNLLWTARSDDGLVPSRVATDAAGNVYVAGVTSTVPSGSDFVTLKYDPNGNELWSQIHPGGFGDAVHGLEVTATGEAIVVGESSNGESCFDATTIFYEADGTLRWLRSFTSTITCGLDQASDVALGSQGEIYVGGHLSNESDTEFLLIRYDADGNEVWVRTHDESLPQLTSRLRVDNQGNAILTGYSESDFTTLKYSADGDQIWVSHVDISGQDSPSNMVIGPDDAIYVTGLATTGSNSIGTVKLDADGNTVWTTIWDAAVHSDIGHGVALDSAGNVIVSGQGGSAILTVRYAQEQPPLDELSVIVTPLAAPIVIPADGGRFRYRLNVANSGVSERTFDLWITIAGDNFQRTQGPYPRTLAPGARLDRTFAQRVSPALSAGTYSLTAHVGVYPNPEASDGFTWEKEP